MCRSSPRSDPAPDPLQAMGDAGVGHADYKLFTADPSRACDGRTLDPKAKYTLDRLPKIGLSLFQDYYSRVRAIRTRRPSDGRPPKNPQGKGKGKGKGGGRGKGRGRGRIDSWYDDATHATHSRSSSSGGDASSSDSTGSTESSAPGASRRHSSPSATSCLADGAKPRAVLRPGVRKHHPCHRSASMNRRVKGIMKPTDYAPDEACAPGVVHNNDVPLPRRRYSEPAVSACSLGLTDFTGRDDGWVPLGVDFDANVEVYAREVDFKSNMEVYIYDMA